MKLFFLISDKPGGAEQVFKQIVNYYLDNNKIVLVCFFLKKSSDFWDDFLIKDNFKTIYFNMSILKFISNIIKFNKHSNYIFTTHVYVTGIIGLLIKLKILKKKKFIGRESTQIFSRSRGFKKFSYVLAYLLGYSSLDLLVFQTDLMKDELENFLPRIIKKLKVKVIPNPVVITKIEKNVNNYYQYPFIVSAGRLIPEKGFDVLIEAFYKLHLDFPDLKLIILGEGSERKHLEKQIHNLQIREYVFLEGFVENVYTYFKAAKLCVVSSRIEGFPNVLLQMMSQNNNIVSTKCAGGIDDIKGLFVSDTNSAENLYVAIKNCLESSETKKNRKLFDIELESRSIDSFIDKINFELEKY